MSRAVAWALRRWTRLDTRDYVSLLHLGRAYAVVELDVREGDWLAGRTLAELDLRSEGALVLGIERGGRGRGVGRHLRGRAAGADGGARGRRARRLRALHAPRRLGPPTRGRCR
jgi:hypothetical protein